VAKRELRSIYLKERRALTKSAQAEMNNLLCKIFFETFSLSVVKTLHCYLPLERAQEPDTRLLIREMQLHYPHVSIVLPRIKTDTFGLESVEYAGPDLLKDNAYGIPEPIGNEVIDTKEIDMVIVPLLVFDEQGNRVGYGKGYYDHFLAECNATCLKVGVSFFDPVARISDISSHDIPLTHGVTPTRVYTFRQVAPAG
jgi:5-formyltetrahydrofolate cyclo-ligase